jgi:hypothetical protein
MALELDDHSETWGVDDSLEALLLEAVRLKDERDRLLPSSSGEQPAPATLARAGLYDEAQVSMGELARRIDEFRNRLKVKAFQAMIEGRSSVTSGLVHSAESRPHIDLPPELDQLIERMLSPDE